MFFASTITWTLPCLCFSNRLASQRRTLPGYAVDQLHDVASSNATQRRQFGAFSQPLRSPAANGISFPLAVDLQLP